MTGGNCACGRLARKGVAGVSVADYSSGCLNATRSLARSPVFTGLVESLGRVLAVIPEAPGVRLVVAAETLDRQTLIGESICISGCCLSVVHVDDSGVAFQLGAETLSRTMLGTLVVGSVVNIERSMRPSDRLGGHLVTGHIDGVGRLVQRVQEGDWVNCHFFAAPALLNQMAAKGSVAIDGVSLTVVGVTATTFCVALIPHTLQSTTLGTLDTGSDVNLETDLIFKYVARWLETLGAGSPAIVNCLSGH